MSTLAITGEDVERAMTGWPRCPECKRWMQPASAPSGEGLWMCREFDSHASDSIPVLIARSGISATGWSWISSNKFGDIAAPELLPEQAPQTDLRWV